MIILRLLDNNEIISISLSQSNDHLAFWNSCEALCCGVSSLNSAKHNCGDGLCTCADDSATCRTTCNQRGGTHGIDFVPTLPRNISKLSFECSFLYTNQSFFGNGGSRFSSLSFDCVFFHDIIKPDLLFPLTILTSLRFSHTMFTEESIYTIFALSQLEHLSISHCDLETFPTNTFQNIDLPKLKTLNLSNNRLFELNFVLNNSMSRLQTISVSKNMLRSFNLTMLAFNKALTEIDIGSNQLETLVTETSLNVKTLNLTSNFLD